MTQECVRTNGHSGLSPPFRQDDFDQMSLYDGLPGFHDTVISIRYRETLLLGDDADPLYSKVTLYFAFVPKLRRAPCLLLYVPAVLYLGQNRLSISRTCDHTAL